MGLERILVDASAKVVGIASAFVSLTGVELARDVLKRARIRECRLITGTDYAITHPEGLKLAKELGWQVRIGRSNQGIFHPKLVVAGQAFSTNGAIRNPNSIYIGSANLTTGGLCKNIECGLMGSEPICAGEAGEAFRRLWKSGYLLTNKCLRDYSSIFANANRQRPVRTMKALSVIDDASGPFTLKPISKLRQIIPPKRAVVKSDFAACVWAELRSFTGEYAFQVEFPQAAGQVLRRFVHGKLSSDNRVDVQCEDEQIRQMTSRYYPDNGMYRLNIPVSVPNVNWARAHKQGIALVQRGAEGGAPISLRILIPGGELNEVIHRSVAMGTWGKTRTRLYGWF